MRALKTLTLATICTAFAAPVLADAAMFDAKATMYDADFETSIAEHGYIVGAAAYGHDDADYDVYLSDAGLFQPVLGNYDADYEVKIDRAAFAPTEIASR